MQKWGAKSILQKYDDGLCICTCTVENVEIYITRHIHLFMTVIWNSPNKKIYGAMIDNRNNVTICVIDENDG